MERDFVFSMFVINRQDEKHRRSVRFFFKEMKQLTYVNKNIFHKKYH